MITLFLFLIGAILILGLAWWLLSYFSSIKWEGSIQFPLNASPDKVYALLTDLENLPDRRKEIEKVEILQPTEQGQPHWREIASMGGFVEFEVIRAVAGKYWEVRMLRSSFGMKGCWKYTIEGQFNQSLITIEEVSQAEKFWIRGLMQIAGRNATLRQEKRYLQKAFEKAKA